MCFVSWFGLFLLIVGCNFSLLFGWNRFQRLYYSQVLISCFKCVGGHMKFNFFSSFLLLLILFCSSVNALPDHLRIDKSRIIYWQEKKLARTLSEYEKRQLINSYITSSGKPKVSANVGVYDVAKLKVNKQFNVQSNKNVDSLEQVKILSILVDFPNLKADSPGLEPGDTDMFYDEYSLKHYESLLFSDSGYEGPNKENLLTARQYYKSVTGNYFDLTGSVYGWFTASQDAEFYGKRNGTERDVNAEDLVIEAVESLVKQGVNLSEYDQTDLNDFDGDGILNEPDGVIDHILIFHSSIGEEAGGGSLGQNAIWSHRFFVTDDNNQPRTISGSNIKAFNYTINPIDAGIGVVVHEFGHDLGLPDEYDLNDISIGEPVANWSVMSSGSWMGELRGSQPVMFSPKNLDFLQNRFGGQWAKQNSLNLTDIDSSVSVDLVHRGIYSDDINQIKIKLPNQLEDFVKPNSGKSQYYSGEGNRVNNQMSFSVDLPVSSSIYLEMQSQFNIEANYDFFQVFVNSKAISGNATKQTHPVYPNIKNYLDGNSSQLNLNNNEFTRLEYDLSEFSGQNITISFVYRTDEGISLFGIVLDDIKVIANNNVVYSNDAEEDTVGVQLSGFRTLGQYKQGAEHAYYLQLRSHLGLDEGLKLAQYSSGLTLWYSNENYENNNTSVHPGYGDLLLVDTDQRPIYKANGTSVADSSIQVRDAALRLTDQTEGLGDTDLSAITIFDDSNDYRFTEQPESGVILPSYGLSISLLDVSDTFTTAKVQMSYQQKTEITYNANDKRVTFQALGFIFDETDSFEWRFSDGQSSDELNPTVEFEKYQNYTATFTQIKNSGVTNTLTVSLNLTKPLSISNMDISYVDGNLNGTVSAEAGLEPYSISWDLGDGNSATGLSITHAYALSGTYNVTVTVTDDNGDSVTQTKQITVMVPLVIDVNTSSSQLTLSANATVSGGSGKYQIAWDFGDGNSANGASASHTYSAAGNFTVRAVVTDTESSKTAEASETVSVSVQQSNDSSSGGGGAYLLFVGFVGIRRLLNKRFISEHV